MKIAGFTIIRNAITHDFPVVEAITSILPICDEFIVAVGKSDDDTLQLIQSINSPKIKIIETVWDETLRGEKGRVFADETNKAYKAISADIDWCFYVQSDEIIHEKYLPIIQKSLLAELTNKNVDGFILDYKHFYGSYDYYGNSPRWYAKEIRIVRKNTEIYSYADAQSFRKSDNLKLNVKQIPAYVYHYGWVKDPKALAKKLNFQSSFHNKTTNAIDSYDFSSIDALSKFTETHPAVMLDRIKRLNWAFDFDLSYSNYSLKNKIKIFIEKLTGWKIGEYKNYKLV